MEVDEHPAEPVENNSNELHQCIQNGSLGEYSASTVEPGIAAESQRSQTNEERSPREVAASQTKRTKGYLIQRPIQTIRRRQEIPVKSSFAKQEESQPRSRN